MWDLPGPGLEPVSPALAGGFLTTAPPGKSLNGSFGCDMPGTFRQTCLAGQVGQESLECPFGASPLSMKWIISVYGVYLWLFHPSIYLSIYLPIHLPTHPSIYPAIYPSTHPLIQFIHLSTHPPIHPSIHPSIHPPIHASIYPPNHPSFHQCIQPTTQHSLNACHALSVTLRSGNTGVSEAQSLSSESAPCSMRSRLQTLKKSRWSHHFL